MNCVTRTYTFGAGLQKLAARLAAMIRNKATISVVIVVGVGTRHQHAVCMFVSLRGLSNASKESSLGIAFLTATVIHCSRRRVFEAEGPTYNASALVPIFSALAFIFFRWLLSRYSSVANKSSRLCSRTKRVCVRAATGSGDKNRVKSLLLGAQFVAVLLREVHNRLPVC